MWLVVVYYLRDEETVCQTFWPVTNESIDFLFLEVFEVIGSPPKKATNITQTCASRCIKCTFKIDNYLWHWCLFNGHSKDGENVYPTLPPTWVQCSLITSVLSVWFAT